MMLSGALLAAALALVAAQGTHPSGKRKAHKASPAVHAPAERHVQAAPVRAVPPTPAPPARRPEVGTGAAPEDKVAEPAASVAGPTRTAKTKVYTFGAMDVEGKLKTPQLLYFLNRIKLELEMSAPDHRSFMKELERTADDPSL
jgi:hypothetical protein